MLIQSPKGAFRLGHRNGLFDLLFHCHDYFIVMNTGCFHDFILFLTQCMGAMESGRFLAFILYLT